MRGYDRWKDHPKSRVSGYLGILGAMLAVWSCSHLAQAQDEPEVSQAALDAKQTRRWAAKGISGHHAAYVRKGSLLVSDLPLLPMGQPELRSFPELWRDAETSRHYSRLGQLDALAKIAKLNQDADLFDEVRDVRRQESRRHRFVMQTFVDWVAQGGEGSDTLPASLPPLPKGRVRLPMEAYRLAVRKFEQDADLQDADTHLHQISKLIREEDPSDGISKSHL